MGAKAAMYMHRQLAPFVSKHHPPSSSLHVTHGPTQIYSPPQNAATKRNGQITVPRVLKPHTSTPEFAYASTGCSPQTQRRTNGALRACALFSYVGELKKTWRAGIHLGTGRYFAWMSPGGLAGHVSSPHRLCAFSYPLEMELRRGLESSSGSTTSVEEMEQADREMEAAEALADLAHLAVRESGAEEGLWGSKRKRAHKRVKSESPISNQDRATVDGQHGGQSCVNVMINPPKAEPYLDSSKPALGCSSNYPSLGSGRSRQNLSEAEKESRRLRRILANRESARQTIRRRQALCEDLAKKAASLTGENEKLKREKDLALKEFQSLELTNKHLKAQMKVIKVEMESSPGESMASQADLPTTSSNCPFILYSHHPFSSLFWPPLIQSSSPVQSCHGPQDAITVPSNIQVPTNEKLDSCQQQTENPISVNGLRTPVYILPYPLLSPVPDSWNGSSHDSCLGFKHPQGGNSAYNPCSGSSSSKAVHGDGQCSLFPVGVKSEATSSMELRVIDDLNETPAGFAPDRDDQCAIPQPDPTVSVKNETGPLSEYDSCTNGACAKASQPIATLPGKNQELFKLSSTKLVDAVAAAEARRQRKELKKLKNLHSRQCRMNC